MNKSEINKIINFYLKEYYDYDDKDCKLYNAVLSLLQDYKIGETELLGMLGKLKTELYCTFEGQKYKLSKTLSSDQICILNSLETREEDNEYYLSIKKQIDIKLEYLKSNIGKDLDETHAIDCIVNEITFLYASNIESLSEIIKRRKEFNEALSKCILGIKFALMAYAKYLSMVNTVSDRKETSISKENYDKFKNDINERISSLIEDIKFYESLGSQSEADIKILEQAYETNVDRLYKVKMSYDCLLYEAYDLYNANAAINTNSSIDSISEELPDYDTQDFVTKDSIKKTTKVKPETLSEDSLKKSIERTVEILSKSYTSLGNMRNTSAILAPLLATENTEQSESNGMIKLIMYNEHALDPISKK